MTTTREKRKQQLARRHQEDDMAKTNDTTQNQQAQQDDTGTKAETEALNEFRATGRVRPGFVLDYTTRPIIRKAGK